MANHMFTLIAIMLMAGIFGGLLNYYMEAQVDADNSNMPRSLVGGLAAAFLVPIILFFVSSDLLTESKGDANGMLIFAGFCLIASWASRFAMTTVTDRISRESHMAREKADAVMIELRLMQRELEPMLEMETESDGEVEVQPLAPEEELDVTSTDVLTTLGNGRYIFRSMKGLCVETSLDEHTINKTLNIMVARDLTGKVLSKKGIRWYITEKGRQFLAASS